MKQTMSQESEMMKTLHSSLNELINLSLELGDFTKNPKLKGQEYDNVYETLCEAQDALLEARKSIGNALYYLIEAEAIAERMENMVGELAS